MLLLLFLTQFVHVGQQEVQKFNITQYFTAKVRFLQQHTLLPEALATMADGGKIILASTDDNFTEMTLNFWVTSILPLNITNILFLSASKSACRRLWGRNIPCFLYLHREHLEASHPAMAAQMAARAKLIYQALMSNFTVLLSDTDVYYFKNPWHYFTMTSDMETLTDGSNGAETVNGGFTLLRPTPGSLLVYQRMIKAQYESPNLTDHDALNNAIKSVAHKVNVHRLNQTQFASGYKYFEDENRHFFRPCQNCVVVHNNYLSSIEAKVYRLKENHMWGLDTQGYYSKERKYLTYENPLPFMTRDNTTALEKNALENGLAIADILNRTLVLPHFHCPFSECSLLSFFSIRDFDATFGTSYREHSFLQNSQVPLSVRQDIQGPFVIKSSLRDIGARKLKSGVHVLEPKKPDGATEQEIRQWFSHVSSSVLHFGCLYNAFSGYTSEKRTKLWRMRMERGLKFSFYRQG